VILETAEPAATTRNETKTDVLSRSLMAIGEKLHSQGFESG
jgi:hypothetical protein